MTEVTVERAFDAADELGEGATWDLATGRLISVDIMRGRVHIFDPRTSTVRTLEVGQPVGAAAPRGKGGLVLAVRDGFATLDLVTSAVTFIAHVDLDRPDLRMNDGSCDAAGRFWAGTMAIDERPGAGVLYRLDPDGTTHTMLTGVGISNGIDWSPDGKTMYYVDSLAQRLDCFDFDLRNGTIGNRRQVAAIDPADGSPDGLTVDSEGAIWLALWGGSAIRRYLPDGTLDFVLPVPVTYPTTCAFGGADLGDLYITSATIKMTADERRREPLAGAVLRCRPGVAGRPAHAFGG